MNKDEIGHYSALALTAFMGWLTSQDEIAGPFSAYHNAGQAVELIRKFCDAQGWKIDDTIFLEHITELKKKYP